LELELFFTIFPWPGVNFWVWWITVLPVLPKVEGQKWMKQRKCDEQ